LPARLHAAIVIEGDADALDACRARVNALLAEDFDEELRERHTEGRLEYELRVSGGFLSRVRRGVAGAARSGYQSPH
jgi:hypothetical protein